MLQCICAGLVSIIICRLVSNQLCRDCVIMGLVSGSRAIIENPGQSSCTEYGAASSILLFILSFQIDSLVGIPFMGPMGNLQSVPNILLPRAVKFGPPLPPTFSLQHPHTHTQIVYLSIPYVLRPEPPQRILSRLWIRPARKAPDSLPSHLLTPTNSRSLSTLAT